MMLSDVPIQTVQCGSDEGVPCSGLDVAMVDRLGLSVAWESEYQWRVGVQGR